MSGKTAIMSLCCSGMLGAGPATQVQRAVTEVLSNEHGPDQLLVVLDARWAQSLDVTRNVRLFKDASATLLQVDSLLMKSSQTSTCRSVSLIPINVN